MDEENIYAEPINSDVLKPRDVESYTRVALEGGIDHFSLFHESNKGESKSMEGNVTVEYYSEDKSISRESFEEYLDTYKNAVVTPEWTVTNIYVDLMGALNLGVDDGLYVQVKYKEGTQSKLVTKGNLE